MSNTKSDITKVIENQLEIDSNAIQTKRKEYQTTLEIERAGYNSVRLEKSRGLIRAILEAFVKIKEYDCIADPLERGAIVQGLLQSLEKKLDEAESAKHQGADINFYEGFIISPEGYNVSSNEYIKYINRAGNYCVSFQTGFTPLILAVALNCEPIVRLLLDKGAQVNKINNAQQTPLMYACAQGSSCVASFLLERGAYADLYCSTSIGLPAQPFQGFIATAFHSACINCSFDVVKLMVKTNNNLIEKTNKINSPLFLTIRHLENMQELVKDQNVVDKNRIIELEKIVEFLTIMNNDLVKEYITFNIQCGLTDFSFEKLAQKFPSIIEALNIATLVELADNQKQEKQNHKNLNKKLSYEQLEKTIREVSQKIYPSLPFEYPTRAEWWENDQLNGDKDFNDKVEHLITPQPGAPIFNIFRMVLKYPVKAVLFGSNLLVTPTCAVWRHVDKFISPVCVKNLEDTRNIIPYNELMESIPKFSKPLLTLVLEYSHNSVPVYQERVKNMHAEHFEQLFLFKSKQDKKNNHRPESLSVQTSNNLSNKFNQEISQMSLELESFKNSGMKS